MYSGLRCFFVSTLCQFHDCLLKYIGYKNRKMAVASQEYSGLLFNHSTLFQRKEKTTSGAGRTAKVNIYKLILFYLTNYLLLCHALDCFILHLSLN